jgi:hypothetical protein
VKVTVADVTTLPGDATGPERLLLARRGQLQLLWVLPHHFWDRGLAQKTHRPGRLVLLAGGAGTVIQDGGRLGKGGLLRLAGRIDEFFGCPGLARGWLGPSRTVVIEE